MAEPENFQTRERPHSEVRLGECANRDVRRQGEQSPPVAEHLTRTTTSAPAGGYYTPRSWTTVSTLRPYKPIQGVLQKLTIPFSTELSLIPATFCHEL